MSDPPIPYLELEAIFLDVGNTLISIDFHWIARELATLGVDCSPPELQRSEAAIRPEVSRRVASPEAQARIDWSLPHYLALILENLAARGTPLPRPLEEVVAQLAPRLQSRSGSAGLWSLVLDGVPAALRLLHSSGLKRIVVSNSDGSVAESLRAAGLLDQLDSVLDSHLVGVEKPDPRIFHAALEQAGCAAERALHVGDLFSADIVGARAAGVHALLLDPHDDWGHVDCHRMPTLLHLAQSVASARNSGQV